jgi:hypothetical protein
LSEPQVIGAIQSQSLAMTPADGVQVVTAPMRNTNNTQRSEPAERTTAVIDRLFFPERLSPMMPPVSPHRETNPDRIRKTRATP